MKYVLAVTKANQIYYYQKEVDTGFPYWVPHLAHALFFDRQPLKKYGGAIIACSISKERLREVGASLELNAEQLCPWSWWPLNDDKLTRRLHAKHVEEIKSQSWRRPIQKNDLTVYISIASLNGRMEMTTNPLIAQKLWGENVIEGTLIRSLGFDPSVE